jgi:fatty-acid desaturase
MVIDLSVKAIVSAFLVAIAWVLGFNELAFTIANFQTEWPWLLVAFLFTAIVNEWFFHIVLGHTYYARQIDPSRWLYKVLICLGFGTVKGIGIMHDLHHLHADEHGKDSLHWQSSALTFASASPLLWILTPKVEIPKNYIDRKLKVLNRLVSDPWTQFCDAAHPLVTIAIWGLLFLTLPVILFKVIFMGRLVGSIISTLINVLSHTNVLGGYKNFEGAGYNNIVVHYLLLCMVPSALHNNHHNHNFKHGHKVQWFEFDISHYFIETVLMPLLSDKK